MMFENTLLVSLSFYATKLQNFRGNYINPLDLLTGTQPSSIMKNCLEKSLADRQFSNATLMFVVNWIFFHITPQIWWFETCVYFIGRSRSWKDWQCLAEIAREENHYASIVSSVIAQIFHCPVNCFECAFMCHCAFVPYDDFRFF